MPATTMAHPAQAAPKADAAPTLLVPFVRAADEHLETFVDVNQIILANTTAMGPFDVPAYGFIRGIFIQLDATGGVASVTVTKAEDAPFSAVQEVLVSDVNGAPIIGPLSGHDLYLIMKWGGYVHSGDPRLSPQFVDVATGASASGNFKCMLRVPIEVCARDGLGALANQNASSTYKIKVTLNSSAGIYGATPPNTTLPTIRLRLFLDAWTQPTNEDDRGNPQATTPPAHGTTAFWSKTVIAVPNGFFAARLPRVGNYIRDLIFVNRAVSDGTRATGKTLFPDPASIFWDTRLLKQYGVNLWQHQMQAKSDYTAAIETAHGLDNGVFVEDYMHEFDGSIGQELRDGWLPTSQSTRLELQGTWTGASSLSILTCDVSPAGEIFV